MTTAPVRPVPAGALPTARSGTQATRWRWTTSSLTDPGPLLDHLPGAPDSPGAPLAWVRGGSGIIGWGEVTRLHVSGHDRFADADAAWRAVLDGAEVDDQVDLPGTGPVAFASLAFADDSAAGGVLVVPQVVLGARAGTWWLTVATPVDAAASGSHEPGSPPTTSTRPDLTPVDPPACPGAISYADGARSGPQWTGVVAAAIERITAGELDKVVLARDLLARAQRPVDVRWLLGRLAQAYPTCWSFAVDGLVGATPELLVRRERGLVHSRVLAGTIRRTGDDATDARLAGSLAHSGKDLEEHEYAVASVVSALAPHCRTTTAPDAPFVLHLPNVMHLASDVTGVLAEAGGTGTGPSVLTLAGALHPTAAVCGTPREAAAALIAEVEGMDHDRYAGPVGWVDASGDGELGLALRCARVDADDPTQVRLWAGCGVVAASDPLEELAESDAKLVPVRDALGGE